MVDEKNVVALNEFYQYDFSKLKVNVTHQSYSNLAWINVTARDVFIDFLAMPGVVEDGIPVINATRVFMTPVAAASLADTLLKTIAGVEAQKGFEAVKIEKETESKKS
jgi:hypothetical protein